MGIGQRDIDIAHGGESADKWRYVVLLSKLALDLLTTGLLKAFGLLIPALIHKFETNYGIIGLILSMELTLFFMACPLVCFLSKRINSRLLCIVGSLASSAAIILSAYVPSILWFGVAMFLTGLFSAPMNQISHEVLHRYFGIKFGFVNSACLLGGLFGGVMFPPVTYGLLDKYGLEGALICLGAIYLNCVPIAATFRDPLGYENISTIQSMKDKEPTDTMPMKLAQGCHKDEDQRQTKPSTSEENDDPLVVTEKGGSHQKNFGSHKSGILRNFLWNTLNIRVLVREKTFTLLFLPCKYIIQVVMVAWILFVVSFAMAKGLPENLATYLPIAGSVGGFLNQGIVTILLHYRPHLGAAIFTVNMSSVALALFLYPVSSSFIHLLICSFFVGGGVFGGFPATYSVLVSYVAAENFDSMLSIKFFVTGIAVVSSGYMAGTLYDVTGSFDAVFMVLGGMSLAAVFFTVALVMYKTQIKRKCRANVVVKTI